MKRSLVRKCPRTPDTKGAGGGKKKNDERENQLAQYAKMGKSQRGSSQKPPIAMQETPYGIKCGKTDRHRLHVCAHKEHLLPPKNSK